MVAEPSEKQRELLDALRDVDDQFIRAYDCGKEVSEMLGSIELSKVLILTTKAHNLTFY